MAKYTRSQIILCLYISLHFATYAGANIDLPSSEFPPSEKLISESSPPPSEIETFYDKDDPPLDPQLSFQVRITKVDFDESQLICNIATRIDFKWMDTARIHKVFKYLDIHLTDNNGSAYENLSEAILAMNTYNLTQKLWTPIVIFGSEYSWKSVEFPEDKKREDMNIISDGAVMVFVTRDASARSENDFRYFPIDNHFCRFYIRSDPYFAWPLPLNDTCLKDKNYYDSSAKLNHVFSRRRAIRKQGQFGMYIDILFTRKIGYHLIQTFIPSALLTGISIISLLLPVEVAEARVVLCTGVLVALTIFSNEARKAGPVVSYITAMDIWLLGCVSIETLTLIENIIILKITTRRVIPRVNAVSRVARLTPENYLGQPKDIEVAHSPRTDEEEQGNMRIKLASKINLICMIIIIGLFLACNIAFWLFLHFHENDMVNDLNFKSDELPGCEWCENRTEENITLGRGCLA